MKTLKLTVAVLTYNRSRYLLETLNCLSRLIEREGAGICELLVCDNGSVDDTAAIVQEFVERYPFVIYKSNGVNRGFDGNVLAALAAARGEYLWMVSDDDLFVDSSVSAVLRIIRSVSPAYLFINSGVYDQDCMRRIKSLSPACEIRSDAHFENGDEALRLLRFGPFYLNANVVQVCKVTECAEFHEYDGSAFMHVFIALKAMRAGSSYVLSSEYIRQRGDNSSGGGESFIRGVRRVIDYSRSIGYSPASTRSIANTFLISACRRSMQIGAADGNKNEHLKTFGLLFWRYPLFWAALFPISFIPNVILKGIRSAFKSRISIRMRSIDLRHLIKKVRAEANGNA